MPKHRHRTADLAPQLLTLMGEVLPACGQPPKGGIRAHVSDAVSGACDR